MRSLLLMFGLVLLAAAPARADEVKLKNGSTIHGRVVREDKDAITLDLGRGRMIIPRRDIVAIRRTAATPTPPESTEKDGKPGDEPQKKEALPSRATEKRAPAPTPRKRGRDRAPTGPKIVPVERTPRKPIPSQAGPESGAPTRQSSSRSVPPPTAGPDW